MDEAGIDWISVGDHFYPPPPLVDTRPYYETISLLAAMAVQTTRARLGCLVFSVPYRNPAALVKALTTIDHLSKGRLEVGLGAGWHAAEFEAFGFDYPSIGTRLDMLEEAVQIVRGMLRQERTTFEGKHFRVRDVTCEPRPIQASVPIWIGGKGERRTLRIAARYADGWNAAAVSAEEFDRLNGVLDEWCRVEGRDAGAIRRSVNLDFQLFTDERAAGEAVDAVGKRQGVLAGTPDAAIEQVARYIEAGAGGVNVLVRTPWDPQAVRVYVDEVVPELRRRFP